jgi:hypothetical protein
MEQPASPQLCESVILESSWLTTTEYSLVRQDSFRILTQPKSQALLLSELN